MKTPAAIAIIIAASTLAIPKAYSVLGVGDIVHDPTIFSQDAAKWVWERGEWAEKLAVLHNSLTTLRESLTTLTLLKTAVGNPAEIPAILDELALDGALSETGIFETLNEIGGIVREGQMLALQLEYLATPVNLDNYRNLARAGTLYAFMRQSDPMAKYQATELAFRRYNSALQIGEGRARNMRMQLNHLNRRLGSSSTDAETQKVAASIATADAALSDVEVNIQHSAEQVHVAHTMAESRAAEEKEAMAVSLQELNNQVEADLTMPVDDIADVAVNF